MVVEEDESPFAIFMHSSAPKDDAPASPASVLEQQARFQLESYLALKFVPPTDKNYNPLNFWEAHKADFRLPVLAVRYFWALQASSTSNERQFSHAGLFSKGRRAKTSTSTIECLNLLGKNKDVLRKVLDLPKWSKTSAADSKGERLEIEPENKTRKGRCVPADAEAEQDFKRENEQRMLQQSEPKPAAAAKADGGAKARASASKPASISSFFKPDDAPKKKDK
jgi:hypothetical protein